MVNADNHLKEAFLIFYSPFLKYSLMFKACRLPSLLLRYYWHQ